MSTPTRKFAQETKVSAKDSRAQIEALIKRHGGNSFMLGLEPGLARIQFFLRSRLIRFDLKLPDEDKQPQEYRRVWRALLLVIKAKLESMDGTVETFETAFLAHTVLPNGQTVAEQALPLIKQAYDDGKQPPMLLDMTPRIALGDRKEAR